MHAGCEEGLLGRPTWKPPDWKPPDWNPPELSKRGGGRFLLRGHAGARLHERDEAAHACLVARRQLPPHHLRALWRRADTGKRLKVVPLLYLPYPSSPPAAVETAVRMPSIATSASFSARNMQAWSMQDAAQDPQRHADCCRRVTSA